MQAKPIAPITTATRNTIYTTTAVIMKLNMIK